MKSPPAGLGRSWRLICGTYWQLLLPYVNEPPALRSDAPPGYGDDDLRNIHRVLQWLREQMGGDLRWWQDATLLVTADALSFVTTDLLERIGFPEVLGRDSLAGRKSGDPVTD